MKSMPASTPSEALSERDGIVTLSGTIADGKTSVLEGLPEGNKMLVGREAEMLALQKSFALSRDGEARLVTLTGPLGSGRNALLAALRQHVTERGGNWVEIGAEEAQHQQYLAVEACLAALATLATNERPCVLVFKDARWADTASLDLLRRIFSGRQSRSWMMVLSYRDNEDAPNQSCESCENFVRALLEASVPVDRITLGPLLLGMEPEGIETLAELGFEEPERHIVEQQINRLKALAEANPSNYLHLYLAAQAEMARTQNKHGDARELYDEALANANTNAFPQHEAIIAEMAARYYAARNKTDAAKVYYGRAREAYQRWGATEKVAQLDRDHEPHTKMAPQNVEMVEDIGLASGRTLDAVAVVRAAETIAGEIDFDKLIARLMHTLVEIAGADHGALLLSRSGKDHGALLIEAVIDENPTELQIGLSVPVLTSADVSPSIVAHVGQTRASIVVTNATEDTRFAADERIVAKRPASILCFPLIHQGTLSGIVYLEHQATAGVFSKDRVEVLSLLSAQAAIAIENALLVADVRGRTTELSALHEELLRELSERERSEKERANLKEGIIAMQKARLAEMRTPFIPVSHDVMVMPLVGTLDQGRAEEALEIALAGTAARNARVVILDVTGVKVMDEIVATTLLRMVEALGLLGAEAIVTGIRGKVAATLVEIDANFANKVRTLSTLSAGMKHALRR